MYRTILPTFAGFAATGGDIFFKIILSQFKHPLFLSRAIRLEFNRLNPIALTIEPSGSMRVIKRPILQQRSAIR